MDVYEIEVDLRPGVRDTDFVAALDAYLGALAADGRIEGWRLLRRKLGWRPQIQAWRQVPPSRLFPA